MQVTVLVFRESVSEPESHTVDLQLGDVGFNNRLWEWLSDPDVMRLEVETTGG